MSTTYPLIRDNFKTVIHAITPATHSRQAKFRIHTEAVEFVAWVEANAKACWRRFELLNAVNYEHEGLTNAGGSDSLWQFTHDMALLVAYPREFGKFGAENERDLDDAIDADLAQIDKAIGADGSASSNWVDGLA